MNKTEYENIKEKIATYETNISKINELGRVASALEEISSEDSLIVSIYSDRFGNGGYIDIPEDLSLDAL